MDNMSRKKGSTEGKNSMLNCCSNKQITSAKFFLPFIQFTIFCLLNSYENKHA